MNTDDTGAGEVGRDGPWHYQFFQSGTCIVENRETGGPHYYIHAGYGDGSETFRGDAAGDLAAWLNGKAPAPAWARTLKRTGPDECAGACRVMIRATGPMRLPPDDNGALRWREEARDDDDRMVLINRLMAAAKESK